MNPGSDAASAGTESTANPTSHDPSITNHGGSWRDSDWLALVEFLLVALIFYADHRRWIPISKTPELLLLGWLSLRLRGLRWRDVGLTRRYPRTDSQEDTTSVAPPRANNDGGCSPGGTIALGVVLGALLETFQLTVTQPILSRILGRQPDLELFRILTGNLQMMALFIALSWTLAAFGEEMFWRGYLMNRVADVFGRGRGAWAASLVIVSVVFGFAHGYQGVTGVTEEGLSGLFLGLMYLGARRNLWVPILAHGASDTIDMVLLYLGKMPGM